MKRIATCLLFITVLLSLFGCGGRNKETAMETESSEVINSIDETKKMETDEVKPTQIGTEPAAELQPENTSPIPTSPQNPADSWQEVAGGMAGEQTQPPVENTIPDSTAPDNVQSGVILPGAGISLDSRIRVKDATLLETTVTITLENISGAWETEAGKTFFTYICYDADGNELKTETVDVGRMAAKSVHSFQFEIPEHTQKVSITSFAAEYWSKPV